MPRTAMTGSRIRERRIMRGMRQSELAKRVGISPSYLNLIEHNRRRIAGKTLLSLAEVLDVEPALLAEGAEATLITGLREAAGASAITASELGQVEEFAGRFPGWAQVLVDLRRQIEGLERTVESLTDRLAHDPHLADSLHEVISSVTAIRSTSSILVNTDALEKEWQTRFHRNINEDSRRLAEGAEALVRYLEAAPNTELEIRSPQDEVQAFLTSQSYSFPQLEGAAYKAIDETLDQYGKALSDPARRLAHGILAQYRCDAVVLPLESFSRDIDTHGVAPGRLAQASGVDLATVFRRLAMLPEAQVGPVGLVSCDGSGSLTFRKPFPGFAMPRAAGGCTQWPLFQVLAQPHMPVQAKLLQAGRGEEPVQALAVAVHEAPDSFTRQALVQAYMLILPADNSQPGDTVRDVGVTCRICPLADCRARREPSIISLGL